MGVFMSVVPALAADPTPSTDQRITALEASLKDIQAENQALRDQVVLLSNENIRRKADIEKLLGRPISFAVFPGWNTQQLATDFCHSQGLNVVFDSWLDADRKRHMIAVCPGR